jgi:RHH-type proline utilization regulon transcriptional repressor/proline dehydrogenase/delta 1-pyrroline-5-carboxylate dehydrogenase
MKRVICEMGGQNAIIVAPDADLDEAVAGVIASAFGYSGQKCSAASRAILVGPVHADFTRRLLDAARSLRIGDPAEPSTFVGPLIDAEARDRVAKAIERGRGEAELAWQADVAGLGDAYYVGPVVFSDVPPESFLGQEEIFGPVLSLMRAADLDEALAIANATDYGLTGGLYARRPSDIERVRRDFDVGNLYINRAITGAIVGRQPFGGHKMSGIGSKAGGPDYLLQFVNPRTVTENLVRRGFVPGAEK